MATSEYSYFINICFRVSWDFASSPEDQGSVPGRVIPKTQKMVLDAALFNSQPYKVRIKSKVEQSKDWCGNYWKGSFRVTFD